MLNDLHGAPMKLRGYLFCGNLSIPTSSKNDVHYWKTKDKIDLKAILLHGYESTSMSTKNDIWIKTCKSHFSTLWYCDRYLGFIVRTSWHIFNSPHHKQTVYNLACRWKGWNNLSCSMIFLREITEVPFHW